METAKLWLEYGRKEKKAMLQKSREGISRRKGNAIREQERGRLKMSFAWNFMDDMEDISDGKLGARVMTKASWEHIEFYDWMSRPPFRYKGSEIFESISAHFIFLVDFIFTIFIFKNFIFISIHSMSLILYRFLVKF